MFIYYQVLFLGIVINSIYAQDIKSLNITCKHFCDRQHVAQQGNVYWTNETFIDDQKEFLRLEFQNSNVSQPLNLNLSLKELTLKNQSFYQLPESSITNLTIQKINIIFQCLDDVDLQFELFVSLANNLQQNLTIPFQKKCTTFYYDETKLQIKLKNLTNPNISQAWNLKEAKLIENTLANVFEVKPQENQTLYFKQLELILDSENDESAKQLIKRNYIDPTVPYVTNEKPLVLQPKIICKNISDQSIKFHFNLTSFKLEESIIIPFSIKCNSRDDDVANNQEFPIFIGMRKKTSEIYKAGISSNFTSKTQIVPENKNAFQIFIYAKGLQKEQINSKLFPSGKEMKIEITTRLEDEILKIKHQDKLMMKSIDDEKQVILQFECLEQGSTPVYVDLKFNYADNQSKLASFSFLKICGKVALRTEKTLFGEVVYYIICLIAMLFGVQTIRLFTNLIKQDANVPDVTLDTTYKKGYKTVEEEQQIEL